MAIADHAAVAGFVSFLGSTSFGRKVYVSGSWKEWIVERCDVERRSAEVANTEKGRKREKANMKANTGNRMYAEEEVKKDNRYIRELEYASRHRGSQSTRRVKVLCIHGYHV